MEMKPYPAYTDTGLTWLPKIPKHWKAKRIKHICFVSRGASPRPIDDPIYFDDDGEYSWVRISDVTASDKYLLQSEQRLSDLGKSKSVALEPGELFVSIAASVGKPIITGIKCCIHDGFVWLKGLKQDINYFYYLLLSDGIYAGLGKTGTQLNLNSSYIGNIGVPIPPIEEQQIIAAYLDRQTTKIDALIAKKQKLLDLLAEQRVALISQAVTKGNAIIKIQKDKSPAPWLFHLPSGWKRKQLKHISFTKGRIGYENLRAEEYTEEGPYLVSSVHFKDGRIEWDKCNHVTRERFEMSPDIILQKDDVLFMKDGALMGKLAFVDDLPGEACLNSHILLIRPLKGSYLPKYLLYVLMSDIFNAYLEEMAKGTTFLGFSEQSMGNFPLSLPSLEEQNEIVHHLDLQTKRLSDLKTKIETVIERLQEYRAALISSVVTGKVDVRS